VTLLVDGTKQHNALIPGTVITCDHCQRIVPIAPGYWNVSVPHVRTRADGTGVFCAEWSVCTGNEKRTWRDQLTHPALRLGLQATILDDDKYWEGL
jgi:hypothetical protein